MRWDAQSGAKKWSLETTTKLEGKTVKLVASSPALADGTMYFVTDDGYAYAIR